MTLSTIGSFQKIMSARINFAGIRPGSAPAVEIPDAAVPVAQPTADTISLRRPAPRFGSLLERNHGVDFPLQNRVDWDEPAQLLLAFLLKDVEKLARGGKSHLLLDADIAQRNGWPFLISAFTDAITMAHSKVDVRVKAETGPYGLFTLQSATGNRYMNQEALITLGPTNSQGNGSSENVGTHIRAFNKARRNLEYLIMERAGISHRGRAGVSNLARVRQDIEDGLILNALEALAYGSKGLVDAVIVGHDEVLTRQALNKFYSSGPHASDKDEQDTKDKNDQGEKIVLAGRSKAVMEARKTFNRRHASIEEVVEWARANKLLKSFEEFSPGSITQNPTSLQKSAFGFDTDDENGKNAKEGAGKASDDALTPRGIITFLLEGSDDLPGLQEKLRILMKKLEKETGEEPQVTEQRPRFYDHGKDKEIKLDRVIGITDSAKSRHIKIAHVPESARGIYDRDQVILPGEVNKTTIRAMERTLQALIEKKEKQRKAGQKTSNVLLVENTPGGHVYGGNQMLDLMRNAGVPIDVVIQGIGSSCGSWLVSSATGNRFMTPDSGILLHQVHGGVSGNTRVATTEYERGFQYANETYINLIRTATKRDREEVKKDFTLDFFLINSLESLVYGPRGLVDAVLVGPDEVLTRDALVKYLVELKGDEEQANSYIEETLAKHRTANYLASEQDHQDQQTDPLENPLETIKILKEKGYTRKMSEIDRFKPSLGDVGGTNKTMDIYKLVEDEDRN